MIKNILSNKTFINNINFFKKFKFSQCYDSHRFEIEDTFFTSRYENEFKKLYKINNDLIKGYATEKGTLIYKERGKNVGLLIKINQK